MKFTSMTTVLLTLTLVATTAFTLPIEAGNDVDNVRMKRPGFLPSRGKKESGDSLLGGGGGGGGGHAIATRHVAGFLPVRGRKSTDEMDNGYDLLEQQIHEYAERSPMEAAHYGGGGPHDSLPLSASGDNKRSVGFVGMRGRKSAADDEMAAEEFWRHRAEWIAAQRAAAAAAAAAAAPGGGNWYYPGYMNYGNDPQASTNFLGNDKRSPVRTAFVFSRGRR